MTIHSITFAQPIWLGAGLLAAAAVVLLGARLDRIRTRALATFSSRGQASSSLSTPLRALKRILLVLGVLLGCAALARPQRGFRFEEAHRRGIDLLFAVDTSKSMRAPDLKPDRLTRAKLAIRDLVAKFDGNRVGLVAFAGDAFLQCPLTLDRDMFEQTLDAVDTDMIPRGGTDVGRAIEVARAALHNEPANQKLLVFLTDGEDLESHAVEAAQAAGKDGVRIYTVGVGTPGGELIPLPGSGSFVRDEAGAFVRSHLDETTLQAMASAAGGAYRRLGADGQGLDALYRDVLSRLPRDTLESRTRQVPLERYQWPLALSVLCFAMEPLVGERRRRHRAAESPPRRGPKFAVFQRRPVAALLLAAVASMARLAHASAGDGERAYREGKFAQSAEAYQRAAARSPEDVQLQYNLGAAAYKSGDFARAGTALERALHSNRIDLQEKAYYDLGNTLFRTGQKTVEKAPEQTIEQWKKSIATYESAIKLDARDGDAVYNRDLVKRKLAELERQQKQKQDQKNQPQNKPDASKDQQGQKDQPSQSKQGKQDPSKDQQGQKDQPSQNQQGKPDPSKDQQGQKDQPSQNQQGKQDPSKDQQGQKDQPSQNPQGHEDQKLQPGNSGARPTATQPPSGMAADASGEAGERADDKPVPGRLSRNDARALLDALRGDERLMPIAPKDRKRAASDDDVVRKDW